MTVKTFSTSGNTSRQSSAETLPQEASIRWLWGFIQKHRLASWGAIITGMIGGLTAAAEPFFIGVVIDHVRSGVDLNQIAQDIALLIGLSIISIIAFFGQRHFSGEIAYSVSYDIRRALFDGMLRLDQNFYQKYPTGDLISRMYSDLNMIWRLLALGYNRIGSASMILVVAFIALGSINVELTVILFIILAISTALQIRAGMILVPVFERVQDQTGVMTSVVQDAVSGIQTVKTFGREEDVYREYHRQNMEYRRQWLYFKRRNEPIGMLPNMISQLTTGLVVLFGGIMAANETISLGNFTQYLLYLGIIGTALLQLGTMYQRYQQTRGALLRITPLLQTPDIRDAPDAEALPSPKGHITFEHVRVVVDGAKLLDDVSLRIPAGQVTAIVGPTGCGKTLLVSLLARVLDPTEGRVLIDGHDIRHVKLADVRETVAYVPQSTFLFSQALHENVRMGKADISEAEINLAVHISRVSNDLEQLPDGLQTLVGEKGVMLSGGQKQRVAIARAIARDSAILVLDDALSSVDTQTAAEILTDLRAVMRSRTSIIIAHRIGTVKDADRIIVMDEGRIVAEGTHETLIAQDGLYARMVERELQEGKRQDD